MAINPKPYFFTAGKFYQFLCPDGNLLNIFRHMVFKLLEVLLKICGKCLGLVTVSILVRPGIFGHQNLGRHMGTSDRDMQSEYLIFLGFDFCKRAVQSRPDHGTGIANRYTVSGESCKIRSVLFLLFY